MKEKSNEMSGGAGDWGKPVIKITLPPVLVDKDWGLIAYLAALLRGMLSLVRGMGLTFGYFIDPGKVITQQYPENRDTLTMYPRFRGRLHLVHDEGEIRCTACGVCAKACPNGSISVLTSRHPAGHKVLGRYVYRLGQCTLCNLCVESCPFGAIAMGQDFEMAVYDRADLSMTLYDQ